MYPCPKLIGLTESCVQISLLDNTGHKQMSHMSITLTRTTFLKIVADHIHPFIVFPDGSDLFQQDNSPATLKKNH